MSQNVDFLTGLGAGEERAESQYKQLKVPNHKTKTLVRNNP
jgi:hypothetical protein